MVEIKSEIESKILNEHKNIKFPKRIMSQTIEKNKPLILDKKILDKRKIITNMFIHKFGRYFFGFEPVAFEIFKRNFAKYFFHSESPLLDECKILKKIFKKKNKKREKIMSLQNKINVGELYFCTLKSKKTKGEINEANIKEKFFGHSKNYSSVPSKDIISMEFYKVKKADEKKKNLKYYKYSKEVYSSEKNSDSNSEKFDLSQNKIKQIKNNTLILEDNIKNINNFIKIDKNDYSIENSNKDITNKKLSFINKSKNRTQEILINYNNKRIICSTHPNRIFKNMIYNKTTFNSEISKFNKIKINLKNPKTIVNNRSISYNSKYLNYAYKNRILNKPYKFQKLNEYYDQKNSLNDNSDSNFHNKESYNTNTNININENLFRKRNVITPYITRKSKPLELNHPKKLKYKRSLNSKILGLNTCINRCNNKLIKLIDLNKTSVSKNSFSLKDNNENNVDIKKLLTDKNIRLKKADDKIGIQEIFKDAKTTLDNNVKRNPKKDKKNFIKQIYRMSDDMALLMVDKLYKTEIDLKCKRSKKIEFELDRKKKKEQNDFKLKKIRERNKQYYNQMIHLKTQLDFAKNKMLI